MWYGILLKRLLGYGVSGIESLGLFAILEYITRMEAWDMGYARMEHQVWTEIRMEYVEWNYWRVRYGKRIHGSGIDAQNLGIERHCKKK